MKAEAFAELLTSVRQAGAIRRGERKPSRTTTFRTRVVAGVRRHCARNGQAPHARACTFCQPYFASSKIRSIGTHFCPAVAHGNGC